MGQTSVVISGGDEVRVRLDALMRRSIPEIVQAVNVGTGIVENKAKHLVPVDTGNLQSSIGAVAATYDSQSVTGSVIAGAEYAVYVECGTGQKGSGTYPYKTPTPLAYSMNWTGRVAKPYLFPALLKSASQIRTLIAQAIRKTTKG